MRDRSTIVDLVLAFAATFVITLALWPRQTPRQVVRCNTIDFGWKTYSIAIDDPSLEDLKRKVEQWKSPETHPEYVTAKWQKEVAEFYENCKPCEPASSQASESETPIDHVPLTATISDTVILASYETDLDDDGQVDFRNDLPGAVQPAAFVEPAATAIQEQGVSSDEDEPSPSDANYWSSVKASAVASLEAFESRSANVPVQFAEIIPQSWPPLAFHCAFLFGIIASCGYMHWLAFAPVRPNAPLNDQPLRVLARIGTFSGAIVVAIMSAVAVWI